MNHQLFVEKFTVELPVGDPNIVAKEEPKPTLIIGSQSISDTGMTVDVDPSISLVSVRRINSSHANFFLGVSPEKGKFQPLFNREITEVVGTEIHQLSHPESAVLILNGDQATMVVARK